MELPNSWHIFSMNMHRMHPGVKEGKLCGATDFVSNCRSMKRTVAVAVPRNKTQVYPRLN